VQVMHCERGKPSNLDYLLQDWAISVNKLLIPYSSVCPFDLIAIM
jgi:hypothetical protein